MHRLESQSINLVSPLTADSYGLGEEIKTLDTQHGTRDADQLNMGLGEAVQNSVEKASRQTYAHCVSASNPVCPPHVCSSIKSCPVKRTREPIVWGPVAWNFLHVVSVNFPKKAGGKHRKACRRMLNGLPYMLPCGDCGRHLLDFFEANSKEMKTACKSRKALTAFMVSAHNNVNKKLGKPEWTTEQAARAYRSTHICLKNEKVWTAKTPLLTDR